MTQEHICQRALKRGGLGKDDCGMPIDMTIVYPPSVDYRFMHQRPQQIMKAFAMMGAQSIYINPANMYRQKQPIERPFADLPNFRVIRSDVPLAGMLKGRVILWCAVHHAAFADSADFADLVAFDSVDLAEDEFSCWRQAVVEMEERADVIFATAKAIQEDHASRGHEAILLPNAADFDHFRWAQYRLGWRPDDLPSPGNKPLVGYHGAIGSWLDLEMVYAIADNYPVVMVGRNRLFDHPVRHSNITVLRMKSYDMLPIYLSWFDVTLIPFRLTRMVAGCDPIKFYEYLSAGKPVVTSQLLELEGLSQLCYFAHRDNAAAQVAQALSNNTAELVRERQFFAQQNQWIHRAQEALKVIDERLSSG